MKAPLILASGSPRRIAFLNDIGLTFEIRPAAKGAEPLPAQGECPKAYAVRSAFAKLFSLVPVVAGNEAFFLSLENLHKPSSNGPCCSSTFHSSFPVCALNALLPFLDKQGYYLAPTFTEKAILAADTIVVLEGEILGKPSSDATALAMLQRLAGKEHEVITAVAIMAPAGIWIAAQSTKVGMGVFPEAILKSYVATGEPSDKAGAYAVQGKGSFLIEYIQGSWSNVVGLPLPAVISAMSRLDLLDISCF